MKEHSEDLQDGEVTSWKEPASQVTVRKITCLLRNHTVVLCKQIDICLLFPAAENYGFILL